MFVSKINVPAMLNRHLGRQPAHNRINPVLSAYTFSKGAHISDRRGYGQRLPEHWVWRSLVALLIGLFSLFDQQITKRLRYSQVVHDSCEIGERLGFRKI
jgi:hypothetical protein